MRTLWQCEKCDEKFIHEEQCLEHEQECKLEVEHNCDKCGKVTIYVKNNSWDVSHIEESCWTFTPNHYRAGYGSRLDGSEFVLNLCDDCLYDFIVGCAHEERIRNSGSNCYYDYPDDYKDDVDEDKSEEEST
jgi:hypothetical protein